jgi:hypothetical protein
LTDCSRRVEDGSVIRSVAFIVAILAMAAFAATPASAARWKPGPDTTWQIQFSGRLDASVNADAFDVDMFDTSARQVRNLHGRGRKVVCYINAGAWEDWRPDAGDFPTSVKGKELDGWPGEKWLDVRRVDLLGPILGARLDRCDAKGFDGVEFDNVDGYQNDTGFPLSRADQLTFNRWLASAAHSRGLSVGLKNALGIADELEPDFDFAIVEQCFFYSECGLTKPFVEAGKSVIVVEYDLARSEFCGRAARQGVQAMRKHLSLDAWRRPC